MVKQDGCESLRAWLSWFLLAFLNLIMHYISAALISELLKHSNNSLSDSAKIKRASLFESVSYPCKNKPGYHKISWELLKISWWEIPGNLRIILVPDPRNCQDGIGTKISQDFSGHPGTPKYPEISWEILGSRNSCHCPDLKNTALKCKNPKMSWNYLS